MEPHRLNAVEALARIRAGTLKPSTLVASCLERIAEREPILKAFAFLDPAEAMRQAEACDKAADHSGLAGLPVGVKDIIETADMPTAYGSKLYLGHRPSRDAACITILRQAGAVIPGKTATTEFAGAQPSPAHNPHNPACSPGGSSAGSPVAVADFMLPFAIGTQTAGSIIRPAAFCGVVGVKPSFGTIDITGVRPCAHTFDTLGTMGRSVADAALLLSILAKDAGFALDGDAAFRPRIGLCRTPQWAHANAQVQAALIAAADLFGRAGASVRDFDLPAAFEQVVPDHITVMATETLANVRDDMARGEDKLGEHTLAAARAGYDVTPEQDGAARARLDACKATLTTLFEDVDILLCPSAADEAPKGLGWTGDPIFNRMWSALRGPCLTLPFTKGTRGLPIGVQLVAAPGQDKRMLAAALWLEAQIGAAAG